MTRNLAVATLLALSCATAPPSPPLRTMPPEDAWPFCASWCASQGIPFVGIILADPAGKRFGCGCGAVIPSAPAVPQAYQAGPT